MPKTHHSINVQSTISTSQQISHMPALSSEQPLFTATTGIHNWCKLPDDLRRVIFSYLSPEERQYVAALFKLFRPAAFQATLTDSSRSAQTVLHELLKQQMLEVLSPTSLMNSQSPGKNVSRTAMPSTLWPLLRTTRPYSEQDDSAKTDFTMLSLAQILLEPKDDEKKSTQERDDLAHQQEYLSLWLLSQQALSNQSGANTLIKVFLTTTGSADTKFLTLLRTLLYRLRKKNIPIECPEILDTSIDHTMIQTLYLHCKAHANQMEQDASDAHHADSYKFFFFSPVTLQGINNKNVNPYLELDILVLLFSRHHLLTALNSILTQLQLPRQSTELNYYLNLLQNGLLDTLTANELASLVPSLFNLALQNQIYFTHPNEYQILLSTLAAIAKRNAQPVINYMCQQIQILIEKFPDHEVTTAKSILRKLSNKNLSITHDDSNHTIVLFTTQMHGFTQHCPVLPANLNYLLLLLWTSMHDGPVILQQSIGQEESKAIASIPVPDVLSEQETNDCLSILLVNISISTMQLQQGAFLHPSHIEMIHLGIITCLNSCRSLDAQEQLLCLNFLYNSSIHAGKNAIATLSALMKKYSYDVRSTLTLFAHNIPTTARAIILLLHIIGHFSEYFKTAPELKHFFQEKILACTLDISYVDSSGKKAIIHFPYESYQAIVQQPQILDYCLQWQDLSDEQLKKFTLLLFAMPLLGKIYLPRIYHPSIDTAQHHAVRLFAFEQYYQLSVENLRSSFEKIVRLNDFIPAIALVGTFLSNNDPDIRNRSNEIIEILYRYHTTAILNMFMAAINAPQPPDTFLNLLNMIEYCFDTSNNPEHTLKHKSVNKLYNIIDVLWKKLKTTITANIDLNLLTTLQFLIKKFSYFNPDMLLDDTLTTCIYRQTTTDSDRMIAENGYDILISFAKKIANTADLTQPMQTTSSELSHHLHQPSTAQLISCIVYWLTHNPFSLETLYKERVLHILYFLGPMLNQQDAQTSIHYAISLNIEERGDMMVRFFFQLNLQFPPVIFAPCRDYFIEHFTTVTNVDDLEPDLAFNILVGMIRGLDDDLDTYNELDFAGCDYSKCINFNPAILRPQELENCLWVLFNALIATDTYDDLLHQYTAYLTPNLWLRMMERPLSQENIPSIGFYFFYIELCYGLLNCAPNRTNNYSAHGCSSEQAQQFMQILVTSKHFSQDITHQSDLRIQTLDCLFALAKEDVPGATHLFFSECLTHIEQNDHHCTESLDKLRALYWQNAELRRLIASSRLPDNLQKFIEDNVKFDSTSSSMVKSLLAHIQEYEVKLLVNAKIQQETATSISAVANMTSSN